MRGGGRGACRRAGQHVGRSHGAAGGGEAAARQHLHPPGRLPRLDVAGRHTGSPPPVLLFVPAPRPLLSHVPDTNAHPLHRSMKRFSLCSVQSEGALAYAAPFPATAAPVSIIGPLRLRRRPATGGGRRGADASPVVSRWRSLQQHSQRRRHRRRPRQAHQGRLAGAHQPRPAPLRRPPPATWPSRRGGAGSWQRLVAAPGAIAAEGLRYRPEKEGCASEEPGPCKACESYEGELSW